VSNRVQPSQRDSTNHRPARATPGKAAEPAGQAARPADDDADGGRLLREAVENPGACEIPDEPRPDRPDTDLEIPEERLEPAGDRGQSLTGDPAIMTVKLSKPAPHGWVQLFPDRTLSTVMLGYKPSQDRSPDYYWVAENLRPPVQKHLRQVRAHLVFDVGGDGEAFLWLLPENDRSPYYAAVCKALATGDAFVHDHLFQFEFSTIKVVNVRFRPRGPDDRAAVLPSRSLSKLLYEALGPDRQIRDPGHPIYQAVTTGARL
jgi:hypothetical protein